MIVKNRYLAFVEGRNYRRSLVEAPDTLEAARLKYIETILDDPIFCLEKAIAGACLRIVVYPNPVAEQPPKTASVDFNFEKIIVGLNAGTLSKEQAYDMTGLAGVNGAIEPQDTNPMYYDYTVEVPTLEQTRKRMDEVVLNLTRLKDNEYTDEAFNEFKREFDQLHKIEHYLTNRSTQKVEESTEEDTPSLQTLYDEAGAKLLESTLTGDIEAAAQAQAILDQIGPHLFRLNANEVARLANADT